MSERLEAAFAGCEDAVNELTKHLAIAIAVQMGVPGLEPEHLLLSRPPSYGVPRSIYWVKTRAEHLKKHPTCAACGRDKDLEVHHLQPYWLAPHLECESENLLTLCSSPGRNDHFVIGHALDWRAYNPHAVKDAALLLSRIQSRLYALPEAA